MSDWSPPQFGLKWILIFTVLIAIVAAVARVSGPDVIMPIVVVLLFCWLVFGYVRLVTMSRRQAAKGNDEIMSFEFDIYVAEITEKQADEVAARWSETTSGARAGQEYVGFKREAHSMGEAIDQAIADLKTLGIAPVKVEADYPSKTAPA